VREHKRRALAIAIGSFVFVMLLVAVIAPLRRATTLAASRVALVIAGPWVPSIKGFEDLPEPTRVLAADGSTLGIVSGGELREPVALVSLPDHVKHAVLAAEDQNFYGHGGIDPEAVLRAAVRTVQGKREGGSTITQQLAKINYAGSRRTIFRKAREALYTLKLEQNYSKDALLERYINQVYFGDGAYGLTAAARSTFGVEPAALTPAQAALLTGRIRGPVSRDPRDHPELATARRDVVLRVMKSRGWLTKQEFETAIASPLSVRPQPPAPGNSKAPHFVEYATREAAALEALGGSTESRRHRVVDGGLTLETTLDPTAYGAAVTAVGHQLGGPGDPTAAVVSIAPGDGAIRSLFGGLSFDRKFDVASQGRRQTGSAFKPFVYLAALRAGIDPRSVFDGSSPRTLRYKGTSYVVNNFEGQSSGPITVDEALVHSVNTVFAQLVLASGVAPNGVVQAAVDAGIPDTALERDRDRPSVALGGLTRGVSPLDMADAYATLASGGRRAAPYAVARIRDRSGHVLYTHQTHAEQTIDHNVAGVLNAALIQVVARGTGTAAQVPGWTVGGKTGTTQKFGDAWFVGITPPLTTAVWVGHPERIVPMTNVHGRSVTGGSFPASIFAETMRAALAGKSPEALFTVSPDVLGLNVIGAPSSTVPTSIVADTTTTESTVVAPPPETTPPPTEPPPSSTTRAPTTTTNQSSTTSASTTTTSKSKKD
jgi:penicillin-binding protein 1A